MRHSIKVTIFTAERYHVWNTSCQALDRRITDAFELRNLNSREVEDLVDRLEKHQCLGPHLENLTREERVQEFTQNADRQLLVALHEATLGRPFEDILVDEFNQVEPEEARRLYQTVCTLNRFRVPVRAGLISRVHDISFETFKERFVLPLEHVVRPETHRTSGDFQYRARHPEIAEIVFTRILNRSADRYNEYIRILRELNIAFSSDKTAFRGMIRGRSILELFPSREDAAAVFDAARDIAGDDAYLFQQMAIYEKAAPGGDLNRARELLDEARKLAPHDHSIIHSLAELLLEESERAKGAFKAPTASKARQERPRSNALSASSRRLLTPHFSQNRIGALARCVR